MYIKTWLSSKFILFMLTIVLISACTTEGKLGPSDSSETKSTNSGQSSGDLELLEWEFVEGEYWPEIKGIVANNTSKNMSMVTITFALYDNENFRVGEALDIIDSLGAGQKWKFAAMVTDENATNAEPVDLTGYPE